ncbi:hypothetical protein SE17_18100 [Kouleothrix aurantiaca]|uniref:STAS domain-containing protein n=1 Tax=Kouleothrix aurantiaca TaxID=186479 RepID=A0A0P9DFL8_9CHLR|nr:hypothetical protein SE17_18100 [Kouleothrix aurantiaca]
MTILNDTAFTNTRRRFLRLAALIILAAAGVSFVLSAVLLLITFERYILVYGVLVLIVGSGSALTLLLLRRHSLGLAVIPVAGSFVLTVVGAWLFVPELAIVAVLVLAIVVLLMSISGNRSLTLLTATICALLAILVLGVPQPLPAQGPASFVLEIIKAFSAGAIIMVIWLIADRYTNSHSEALALVEQRAAEAEIARTEAEAARFEAEVRNADQQRLLELVQTLELPIITIGPGVLVAPLVGNLDSRRVDAIQRRLLATVAQQRAHTVVLDVTGISVIDTAVARALMNTAQAVRLLGAQTLMSGISASIAQTLVSLGVGFETIQTVRDLGQALERSQQHSPANTPLDR